MLSSVRSIYVLVSFLRCNKKKKICEWTDELMNEWMNEWMIEWARIVRVVSRVSLSLSSSFLLSRYHNRYFLFYVFFFYMIYRRRRSNTILLMLLFFFLLQSKETPIFFLAPLRPPSLALYLFIQFIYLLYLFIFFYTTSFAKKIVIPFIILFPFFF